MPYIFLFLSFWLTLQLAALSALCLPGLTLPLAFSLPYLLRSGIELHLLFTHILNSCLVSYFSTCFILFSYLIPCFTFSLAACLTFYHCPFFIFYFISRLTRQSTFPSRISFARSSRLEVFCKKGILKNFAKFTAKHRCQRCQNTFSYRTPPVAASILLMWPHTFCYYILKKFLKTLQIQCSVLLLPDLWGQWSVAM